MITSNITQGTSTVQVGTNNTFIADFSGSTAPSVHELVSGSTTERIMIFRTANTIHTFTIPTGGINCDVLMIGGGGGGGTGYANGGGAGACIVSINQTLPAGSCIVFVGAGGGNLSNGQDSLIQVATTDRYRAKGGGYAVNSYGVNGINGGCGGGAGSGGNSSLTNFVGGQPVATNVITLSSGLTSNIGPCLSSTFAVLGNAGFYNTSGYYGGGGIGSEGTSVGGAGKSDVSINGNTYNFASYFANGLSFGVNGVIGKGGSYGGSASGASNTGDGATGPNSNGGSGIIIIRYRSVISVATYTHTPTITTTLSTPTLGTPSIELVRGTQGDSNRDYKIGNYEGDFIVKSSVSGVDTDYIRIVGTSASIFNSTASPQWSTVSDRRIKENIERASYDKCYDTINKLELYRFNYIKELNNINKDKTQLGYIAQEVNDVFPKAVSSYEFNNTMLSIPDLLSIDIAQINYSLYGAVKKLIEINNNKELRLKRLECLLNVEDNGIGSTNVIIIDDTMTSNVVVEDVLSSNMVIIEDTMTSNMVIIEDTMTSNMVVDCDVLSSNVVVEDTMSSNVVIEDTMTSNVVVIEDTMTSNVVIIDDTMSSNVVVEDVLSSNMVIIEDTMTSNIVIIEDTMTSNLPIEDTNNI